MRPSVPLALAFFFCLAAPIAAQEKERVTCNTADPTKKCPGADCVCVADTFEVTFDGNTQSNLVGAKAGDKASVVVMTETKSAMIQGWSYGVSHDETLLTLNSATTEGTDMKKVYESGFDATSMEKIETCAVPTDPKCATTKAGGGWISAVVLSLTMARELPAGRNSIAKAEYTVTKVPSAAGTLIMISDRLKKTGSPPVAINFTIAGKSRVPTKVIDGFVEGQGGGETNCTDGKDDDADGKIDCADSDCTGNAACKETLCKDGKDNDTDGKTDCDDTDCVGTVDCPKGETNCTDGKDDDADGKIDCADSDCAGNAACKENCTDGKDNDADGKVDCADSDCTGNAACKETLCKDGKDNDTDGKTDCDDSDCVGTVDCPPGECPDYAFIFGPAVTKTALDVKDGKSYVISMRNKDASLGFQLGVKTSKSGANTNWEFAGTLGADQNRIIELIISDDKGNSKTPTTPNKATSTTAGPPTKVERGAAISKFSTGDFFAVDLNPAVGGPGFTVGYVADTDGGPAGGNKIPATPTDAKCVTNEILTVSLGTVETQFRRGDADGSGRLNVIDAILIIQIEVGNITEKFDCDDALDANDDGNTTVADATTVLSYVFQRGPEPPDPFPACGMDPTADSLTCNASTNCP